MTTLMWAFAAAAIAVPLELVYRRADSWPLWAVLPGALLTYCIYRTIHAGPSYILAIAGFSMFTLLLRVAVSGLVLGEAITRGNLVAALALFIGVVFGRLWR